MIKQVRYYKDELNDDFAGTKIKSKLIDDTYKYLHKNVIWIILEFIVFRLIAQPLSAIFYLILFGLKVKNRRLFRKARGSGYFIYANHVQLSGDALVPHMVTFPKKPYIVVNPDAISLPFMFNVVQMLGAIPLPSTLSSYRGFLESITHRIKTKKAVLVFPEAHIWPYYTGIRAFGDASFAYPVRLSAPVFAMTTTFKKRLIRKRPKSVVYIDGPFYPDKTLAIKDQKTDLRDKVYNAMCERSKLSNCEYIQYIKVD